MKKQNKVMVGALALLVMGTSSLAYFTDRVQSTFTAQAGTVCLTHVDSQSDLLNMAPGDLRDISFEYKNEGSLAMDTRVTYMLSYEVEDGKAGTTEGKVVTLLDGEDELVTKEVGDGVAKVTVNEATIQGTTDKVGEATLKKNLKLKLHESVANNFQDATFHIDVVIEGKQNKNDAKWEEINTERITVRADQLDVVRQSACNVETPNVVKTFAIFEDIAKQEYEERGTPDKVELIMTEEYINKDSKDITHLVNNDFSNIDLDELNLEVEDGLNVYLLVSYDGEDYMHLSSEARSYDEILNDYKEGKPAFVVNKADGGMEPPVEEE